MPPVPIRGVGKLGILTDPNPYDTPVAAASDGRNVRFRNGNVVTSPVFKELTTPARLANQPVLVFQRIAPDGTKNPNYLVNTGTMSEVISGVPTATTVGAFGAITTQSTVDNLGESYFVNNQSWEPRWRGPAATSWIALGDWVTTDRCRAMRAYKDFLVCLNISKSGVKYSNMVKWSNNVQAGSSPLWNPVTIGTNAGETVLNDNLGELVDGCQLGNSFIIYGVKHVFRMDYVAGQFLFNFDRIFSEGGVMSVNCVVEKDQKHYVFGRQDIYVHDGIGKDSIVDNRVRKRIFSRLNYSLIDRCFVSIDESASEIKFCYPVIDGAAYDISLTPGCNEAAVFNYAENTWSFIDLPGVTSICQASVPAIKTWNELVNWNLQKTANWMSFDGNPAETPLAAMVLTTPAINSLMFMDEQINGLLPNEVTTAFAFDAFIEYSAKDFDEYGIVGSEYKLLRSVSPQVATTEVEDFIMIQCGTARHARSGTIYETARAFFPWTSLKHDTRSNSNYLSVMFSIPAGTWAELSGFDLDLTSINKRG